MTTAPSRSTVDPIRGSASRAGRSVRPKAAASAAAAPAREAGRLERLARRVVIGRLAGLAEGTLELHEGSVVHALGAGDPVQAIQVVDPAFWRRLALGGSLGAAESWAGGEWRTDDLAGVLRLLLRNMTQTDELERGLARAIRPAARLLHGLRANTRRGSRRNIHAHYDLGNDFFALWLDPTMTYSAGIFEAPGTDLESAQLAKLERLCAKLDLRPEHHLLEIGTGWGSMAIHAARTRGCRVTTTTISRAQHDLAVERVRAEGLADRVEVRLEDYRDLRGTYDRVVSIEMIEAVGHRYLPAYFETVARRLAPDGLAAIQAITMPDHRYEDYRRQPDFIQRVVFPGSCCPSMTAMSTAMSRRSDLRLVHVEDLSPHYARTLRTWRERFDAVADELDAMGLDARFRRTWRYYLAYCEAGFAERHCGVVQMLLSRPRCRLAPVLPPLDAGGARDEDAA